MALIYLILSLIGLAMSVGYTSVGLKNVDAAVVSILCVAVAFTLIMFVVNVYKSEAYREYQINKRNEAIMERNKRQNESRQKIYNRPEPTQSKFKNNHNVHNVTSDPPSQIQIHYPEP